MKGELIIMSNNTFYNENDQALKMPNIVTRDSLGTLAVKILSAKNDLSTITDADYNDLVRQLYDIICNLDESYQYLRL